ncbi:regulator of g-protein signaling 17 [Limosa lapponica baueri]|uniref:Regulator of g-protein signaling 17 n=1 Tax=Limosa lapponica baueri TaxID=1758121 RepID=A0A2I0U5Q5_LIMLA|nr:regulator of g-protein signaling 17 [Limosa lapponica baueri]
MEIITLLVNHATKWRQRTRCKTGRSSLYLRCNGLRDHIEYQGEMLFLLDKGPPSPPGIFAKLEGLRNNENVEKAKRQTEILDTSVCTLYHYPRSHLGTEVAEMRKRQQSQNEGTSAVSQAPGNQRPNNTCCFCWCCCCSCSCLTVRNEDRGDNAGRPTHTTKMESIQVIEECQNPTADEILSWAQNFDKMMKTPAGRNLFREFLRTEYSEENLLFWLACEDLKKEQNKKVIEEKARLIYEDYISILSPKEVSLDSRVREVINRNLLDPSPHMYEDAQLQIYTLMHRDSFPRFLNSQIYKSLVESITGSTSET